MRSWSQLARQWCQVMHKEITWPRNGMYRCVQCNRVYRVAWDVPQNIYSRIRTKEHNGGSLLFDGLRSNFQPASAIHIITDAHRLVASIPTAFGKLAIRLSGCGWLTALLRAGAGWTAKDYTIVSALRLACRRTSAASSPRAGRVCPRDP